MHTLTALEEEIWSISTFDPLLFSQNDKIKEKTDRTRKKQQFSHMFSVFVEFLLPFSTSGLTEGALRSGQSGLYVTWEGGR